MGKSYPMASDRKELVAAEEFLTERGIRPRQTRLSVEELKQHLERLGCSKIAVEQLTDHFAAQAEMPRRDPASGELWLSRETVAGWTPEIALTFLLEKAVREREG